MIELYLSKVTETSESEQAGKLYARVDYKESLSVQDMAHHMAEHNTAFSEGLITGILIDFVRYRRGERPGDPVRRAERQGGSGYDWQSGGGCQDRCRREDHQIAGSEHGRVHARRAEEGRQAGVDRQDQG